jgi:alkaline phosphatase
MTYVDGYVIPVPKNKVRAYRKMAEWGKRTWMKYGALGYYECIADDLKGYPSCGTFTTLARLRRNETVFFSFVIYRSKAHRNRVNKRVMADMQNSGQSMDMPFQLKRMAFGGFRAIVKAKR